eukprot:359211-Chlamydomonas_euryale.AAC.5
MLRSVRSLHPPTCKCAHLGPPVADPVTRLLDILRHGVGLSEVGRVQSASQPGGATGRSTGRARGGPESGT